VEQPQIAGVQVHFIVEVMEEMQHNCELKVVVVELADLAVLEVMEQLASVLIALPKLEVVGAELGQYQVALLATLE
jgi:hypothetical protein